MLLTIFEPKNCSEETTGPNWIKFGMNDLNTISSNIIEAFFDIPPPSRVTGPPAVPLGAQKWPKIFFQFFKFFRFYWIDWCLKCMSIAKYQGFLPNSNEYRRLQLQWSNLLRRRSTFHFFSVSAFFHRGFEGCIPTLIRRITFILSSIPVGLTMSGATTSLFTKLLLIRDRKALWFETPTLAEIMPFFLISFFPWQNHGTDWYQPADKVQPYWVMNYCVKIAKYCCFSFNIISKGGKILIAADCQRKYWLVP